MKANDMVPLRLVLYAAAVQYMIVPISCIMMANWRAAAHSDTVFVAIVMSVPFVPAWMLGCVQLICGYRAWFVVHTWAVVGTLLVVWVLWFPAFYFPLGAGAPLYGIFVSPAVSSLLLLCAQPVVWNRQRRWLEVLAAKRRTESRCVACGYDRTGLPQSSPAPCPECGEAEGERGKA